MPRISPKTARALKAAEAALAAEAAQAAEAEALAGAQAEAIVAAILADTAATISGTEADAIAATDAAEHVLALHNIAMPDTPAEYDAILASFGIGLPVTDTSTDTGAQADAPAPDAPAPEAVTASARARRAAIVADLLARGADARNVRSTTSVRIGSGVAKYQFDHLAKLPFAKRISGLPPATQTFYHINVKAFSARNVSAEQFDNAKLARCISAGLVIATGGTHSATHRSGDVAVRFVTEAEITAQLAAEAEAAKRT